MGFSWRLLLRRTLLPLFFIATATCIRIATYAQQQNSNPKYEFRAAWIATVTNIDWPSQKGLSSIQQQEEFINILNKLQAAGFNAVVVQIRPAADAFYPSAYEPWSEFLSGAQGKAPSPYYDPLKFMIEEAHKRNMEFHAWLNPYRAVFDINKSSVTANHITKKRKDWFVTYGTKKYFNPGIPGVMTYVSTIVKDIISRYDIDAVHMDDYFYPYRIKGREFPDHKTYQQYGKGKSKDEWRRNNCDSIIKKIHDVIIETKPMIRFGISPFGVWRNIDKDTAGSNTKAGQTNYDDLYADILLWLKNGWIDYVVPQLYWEIGHPLCDYNTLLDWWANHSYGKQVYIGHGIYRTSENPTPAWRKPDELPEEIRELRNYSSVQGSVYFSCKNILANPNGWYDSLQRNYYASPALIPPMDWIDTEAPEKPIIENIAENNNANFPAFNLYVRTASQETEEVKTYAVYISDNLATLNTKPAFLFSKETNAKQQIVIGFKEIPAEWQQCYLSITAVDKENNESELSTAIQLLKTTKGWKIKK